MRIKLLFIILMSINFSLFAETSDEKKKEIFKIKASHNYVYAEMTSKSQQEAMDLATELLYQRVNEYVATQKKFKGADQIVTVNTNYEIENITMPRGDVYRAFIYVKKSDIIPANNALVTDKKESVNSEKSAKGKASVGEGSSVEVIDELDSSSDEVLSALLKCETTDQLRKCLSELKSLGKIDSYNKLSKLQNAEECIMVVFDTSGKITALLTEGPYRKNVQTSAADALGNYKGCGAIGVKRK